MCCFACLLCTHWLRPTLCPPESLVMPNVAGERRWAKGRAAGRRGGGARGRRILHRWVRVGIHSSPSRHPHTEWETASTLEPLGLWAPRGPSPVWDDGAIWESTPPASSGFPLCRYFGSSARRTTGRAVSDHHGWPWSAPRLKRRRGRGTRRRRRRLKDREGRSADEAREPTLTGSRVRA